MLFVRPNFRLGNLLLTTPGISAANRALPRARVHLLTTPRYRALLRDHPDLDRVLVFRRRMLFLPWGLLALIRRIRRNGYDLVVDCSDGASLGGALFVGLSGGRWRLGPTPSRHEAFFNVRVPQEPGRTHVIDRLAGLLEGVGIPVENPSITIGLSRRERLWARRRWRDRELSDRPTIGVIIGARDAKRWPMEHFLRVIRRLDAERGGRVVVFVGPQDLGRLRAVEERLPEDVVVDTTDDVRRFAALLERCDVVITGDSGPMHLAAAVGVPTVSIFLKENYAAYAPRGSEHRVVYDEEGVEPEAVLDVAAHALDAASI